MSEFGWLLFVHALIIWMKSAVSCCFSCCVCFFFALRYFSFFSFLFHVVAVVVSVGRRVRVRTFCLEGVGEGEREGACVGVGVGVVAVGGVGQREEFRLDARSSSET